MAGGAEFGTFFLLPRGGRDLVAFFVEEDTSALCRGVDASE